MFDIKKILLILTILTSFFFCAAFELSAAEQKHIIVIDPAHGGQELGIKINNDISEKDITLAIAQNIKKELARENNLEVVLTRDADKTIDLEDRKKNIEKIKPEFFLSIHVNAGFGKEASGFELYYPEFSSSLTKEKGTAKENSAKIKNQSQNDSLKMAKIIQENFNILFPRKGRGLRKADLSVTDGLLVPTLILEIGFATNSEDKKKLVDLKTQMDISKAVAKSIRTFFR